MCISTRSTLSSSTNDEATRSALTARFSARAAFMLIARERARVRDILSFSHAYISSLCLCRSFFRRKRSVKLVYFFHGVCAYSARLIRRVRLESERSAHALLSLAAHLFFGARGFVGIYIRTRAASISRGGFSFLRSALGKMRCVGLSAWGF